jgi:hypothetical protein
VFGTAWHFQSCHTFEGITPPLKWGATTFSIMLFRITILSILTFSIVDLIVTVSIIFLIVAISIKDIEHYDTQH